MEKVKVTIEHMGDFFNKRADSYNEHMEETIDEFDKYYKLIAQPIIESADRERVLDLGCGTGLEIKGIFEKLPNCKITGIDLSKDMMKEMLKNNEENATSIEFIEGSYLEIPFGEECYDYVVSSMTIHHFLYDVKLELYKKIAAAVKNGGCYIEGDYIVSGEKMDSCLQRYNEIMESLDEDEKGLYHIDIPFDMKTQKELLTKAGFGKVEEIYKNGEHVILVAYK